MKLRLSTKFVLALQLAFAAALSASDAPTADEVLTRLQAGNKRFVAGDLTHPHQTTNYRASLAAGQKPYVTILTCADSRVAPELLFDLGLGDAFVCRVAGNIVDDLELGSLEYAIEHLHTPLLVVLGHEKCGAVKATVDGGEAPGKIGALVQKIAPAVAAVRQQRGDLLANAVRENVARVTRSLTTEGAVIPEAVRKGHVRVIGAVYDIATGEVHLEGADQPHLAAAAAPEK